MSIRDRRRLGASTLVVLFLAFGAAVMASNTLLSGWRLDLTENNLYTLSPGTRSLVRGIEEPINLYFFYSDEATRQFPSLRTYASRVRETLEEFADASDGRLILQTIDPQPFSEEEDRASQLGLTPVNLGAGAESVYFGLAGSNSIGTSDAIPFFEPSPSKEAFLEYDIAKLVYNLANPDKVVVGLVSGAPITGGIDPQTQFPSQPWVVVRQAQQLFEVRPLSTPALQIEDDVDIMWIVHPTNLDDSTLYAIDQFVIRGGRALIFVDPYAEIVAASGDPSGFGVGASSNLEQLFAAWGVQFSPRDVVGDNRFALSIRAGFQPTRHIGLVGLDATALAAEDVITSGLNTINLGTTGHFTLAEGATATLAPLLRSSADAAVLPADRFQFLSDPSELLRSFAPSGTEYVLAARLEGKLASAFPDGPPQQEGTEDGGAIDDALTAAHLAGTDTANVVLVGDVDMLSDRLWVQVQNFLGQQLVTAFANNGDFVINALDNLSGSADLIGLRSRATYSRPFTTVDALRRDAELKFRATEEQLEAQLSETESKLGELQAQRSDQGSLLMSPEQEAEVQRFLDEQVRIRRELRSVRRDLDRDIDALGTTLKVINIGFVPLGLTALALAFVFVRRRGKGRTAA